MEDVVNPVAGIPEDDAPLTREEMEAQLSQLRQSVQEQLLMQQQAANEAQQALAQRESQLRQRELIALTREELEQRDLPISLAESLPFADEAAMKAGLEALETAFRAAVQKGVEERLLSPAPKAAAIKPLSDLSDEEYYAVICP